MRHLVVTNLDPGRIGVLIQPGLHGQAGAGVRGADQLDHGLVAHQRLPTPILGDGGKQTMLNFISICKVKTPAFRRVDFISSPYCSLANEYPD